MDKNMIRTLGLGHVQNMFKKKFKKKTVYRKRGLYLPLCCKQYRKMVPIIATKTVLRTYQMKDTMSKEKGQ
jgi:hypothetical protein